MFLPGVLPWEVRLSTRISSGQNAGPPPTRTVLEGAAGGGYPVGWTDTAFIISEYSLRNKGSKYHLAYHMRWKRPEPTGPAFWETGQSRPRNGRQAPEALPSRAFLPAVSLMQKIIPTAAGKTPKLFLLSPLILISNKMLYLKSRVFHTLVPHVPCVTPSHKNLTRLAL